ncbi:MAG TPA: AmmeMemoRadiSam system protein A, partial [Candidatus Bathyarchaeia archaeon]|nr:AmmeMemoRadiSam system protein A [Candidatus Bathyarchaeia archaeon]
MIDRLSVEDGRILVNIARQAIEANLEGKAFEPNSNGIPELKLLRGVFVTLLTTSKTQALRGCIGNPFPKSSLLDETVRCAIEAATLDPRFEPVERDELSRMTLEVTVLSPVEYLIVKNPLDLPLKIKVGRDGLLVEGEGLRGLLLP